MFLVQALPLEPAGGTLWRHVRQTLALAAPIILARAGMLMMFLVSTLITGWAGPRELAYLGLGIAPQIVVMLVAIGALQPIVVLTAQRMGAGDAASTGEVFRVGMIEAAGIGLVVAFISLLAEPFFRATGQAPDIAAGAGRVTLQFAWGLPAVLMFVATNVFLEATGRPRIGVVVMVAANVVNFGLGGILALGWWGLAEPAGAVGAVMASSVARWLALAAILAYLLLDERRQGNPREVLAGAGRWLGDALRLGGATGRKLLALGVPMGIGQGVESAAFATVVLIAGRLGADALAAHQVTMSIVSLVFMTAIGMGGATAIRVGKAVGAGDRLGARRAGLVGIVLGAILVVPLGVAFFWAPTAFGRQFTDAPVVLAYLEGTIALAGFMLAFDCAAGVAAGALRGYGDAWVPMILLIGAYWLVAVPVALVAATSLGLGPVGLIAGILSGVIVSIALLGSRFMLVSRRSLPPSAAATS